MPNVSEYGSRETRNRDSQKNTRKTTEEGVCELLRGRTARESVLICRGKGTRPKEQLTHREEPQKKSITGSRRMSRNTGKEGRD